ncbi:hypothetical protein BDR26DRAFT_858365 [Obelidium mucronatum]|nr:hypothetical protein BDR26DRAFT_858365 [Obelidium mucronatum]
MASSNSDIPIILFFLFDSFGVDIAGLMGVGVGASFFFPDGLNSFLLFPMGVKVTGAVTAVELEVAWP